MFLASSCSCLYPIHSSQVLNREWGCSWSSADRRCSNYIWVINNFIAYLGESYIRRLMVTVPDILICRRSKLRGNGVLVLVICVIYSYQTFIHICQDCITNTWQGMYATEENKIWIICTKLTGSKPQRTVRIMCITFDLFLIPLKQNV